MVFDLSVSGDFSSKLSYAEISWVKYYRTKGAEFFYNPASIKKSADLKEVNVFVLSNYVFQTNSGEKSVLVRQRLDCNRGRYKILAFKSFSKNKWQRKNDHFKWCFKRLAVYCT